MTNRKTVEISQDAALIRLYAWAWEADKAKIDVCKLFWGFLFLPVALVLQGIEAVHRAYRRRFPKKEKPQAEPLVLKDYPEPKRHDFLVRFNDGFLNWRLKHSRALEAIGFLTRVAFWVGAVAVSLAFIVGVAYVVITSPLKVLLVLAIILGFIAVSVLTVFLVERFSPRLTASGRRIATSTGRFFRATGAIIRSFKYKTCPEIKVR